MNKKELEIIANALQATKDCLELEIKVYESKGERPKLVKYIREKLIPKIDEASKLVSLNFFNNN